MQVPKADVKEMTRLYRQMVLIRRLEEAAAKAYAQGKIAGFLHLYIGMESVAVGAIAALEPTDYTVCTYREHGHAIAKGMPARAIMAELYGRATGCSKGKGGSMHLFDEKLRFLGGYGIVGGHVPLAVGVAWASHLRKDTAVTLCFMGDGSIPMGAFHEGASLAALWKLPVVFIVENNQYSMGTPLYRTLAVEDVTERASGYGMARDRFEAADVMLVRDRVALAVRRAREERIPTLIECLTYRFRGHSMSDPAKYRTKDEVEEWKRRDAVPRLRERLGMEGVAEADLAALENSVDEEVADAVKFAEESPEPDLKELYTDVYA
jgi:pyruvate dehydrogenase E1 component alpha subunit